MEEEPPPQQIDLTTSTTPPPSQMDSTLQKKHQAMLDRISTRHNNNDQHRTTPTTNVTASTFLSAFSESKDAIETALSSNDPCRVPEISSSISSLEHLLAQNSYLLSSYDLRSSLKSVSDLKHTLDTLIPKKKFSFRNANKTKTLSQPEPAHPPPAVKTTALSQVSDSPGFTNTGNEVLVKDFRGVEEVGEFTLSGLDACEVRLMGCVSALFVNRIRDCKVYVGPVMGSVLIEDVERCVFVMASHQIRIHSARGSDFYLRVRSRPIIEDCGGVRFAPYCLEYEGIEEDLKQAGLNEETGNWENVDDFRWLRAVKSPNWSVLEEDERIATVKIRGLGTGDGGS